jgi:CubicO group peptidase (beta-lactamase class C family)
MSGKHTIAVWALVIVIFLMTVLVASAFLIETPAEVNRDPDAVASVNEGSETVSAVGNISPEFTRDSLATLAESADDLGPISSLLIYQSGELIEEEYFGRMSDRSTHNIKSASKSVLSILVGIAIDEGYLDGVDQTIDEYFPDYFESNPDSLKEAITIGDLLTMRSGLASTSRRSYGRWVISENWIEYKLNQPMTGRSGIDRNYSTGNTHLLSVILTRAAGMSTRAFANKYLFEPMDIRVGGWDRDPQGYYMGGNNMALKPRDMIKIGEMMMNMGEYNGKEIVSPEWVVESVTPVTGRRPGVINYGYLWFRRESAGLDMVYAYGNGGQYILIIPEIEAVITVTTRIGASGTRSYRRELFRLFDNTIVPGLYQLNEAT